MELHVVSAAALTRAFNEARGDRGTAFVKLRLLGALHRATPTMRELVDWVYADHADGGPDNAANALRVAILKLRRKGYDIRRIAGHRYEWVRGH